MMEKIFGAVDGLGTNPLSLNGWAKVESGAPLRIEIRIMDKIIGSAVACHFRKDIDLGKYCGFSAEINYQEKKFYQEIVQGNVKIFAIHGNSEEQIEIYAGIKPRFISNMLKLIALDLPDDELRDLSRHFEDIKQRRKISDNLNHQKPAEKLIEGAKSEPLSYFGLRPGLISSDNISVVGRDGFMFILKGSNDLISLYQKELTDNETVLLSSRWITIFEDRKNSIIDNKIIFRQMIVPEKQSFLSHLFPIKIKPKTPILDLIERKIEEEKNNLDGCYINIHKNLIEDEKLIDVTRKIDSHWTPYGVWKKFNAILRSIGIDSNDNVSFERVAFFPGDLSKAFFEGTFREPLFFPRSDAFLSLEEKLECIESIEPPGGGHMGFKCIWKNASSKTSLRVVAFGNSFFERGQNAACLTWWAARWFREFHFLWSAEIDYDYIEKIKPDLVICQTIERFLPKPPEI